jgi:hypothetical protein
LAQHRVLALCAAGAWSTAALAVDVSHVDRRSEVLLVPRWARHGFFAIANNSAITGSVNTAGITGTAAHIHEAAAGKNGPVVIRLTKNGDSYTVPPDTAAGGQMAAFKAGNLYKRAHRREPGGEGAASLPAELGACAHWHVAQRCR